jgi:hypothetical protein
MRRCPREAVPGRVADPCGFIKSAKSAQAGRARATANRSSRSGRIHFDMVSPTLSLPLDCRHPGVMAGTPASSTLSIRKRRLARRSRPSIATVGKQNKAEILVALCLCADAVAQPAPAVDVEVPSGAIVSIVSCVGTAFQHGEHEGATEFHEGFLGTETWSLHSKRSVIPCASREAQYNLSPGSSVNPSCSPC